MSALACVARPGATLASTSNIMRGEISGAMGVRDGGSYNQDNPTDLRPGQTTRDAEEGEGGGAQAGRGSEVGEVSVCGDEECGLGAQGGEASGRGGVTRAEHDGKEPSCTNC